LGLAALIAASVACYLCRARPAVDQEEEEAGAGAEAELPVLSDVRQVDGGLLDGSLPAPEPVTEVLSGSALGCEPDSASPELSVPAPEEYGTDQVVFDELIRQLPEQVRPDALLSGAASDELAVASQLEAQLELGDLMTGPSVQPGELLPSARAADEVKAAEDLVGAEVVDTKHGRAPRRKPKGRSSAPRDAGEVAEAVPLAEDGAEKERPAQQREAEGALRAGEGAAEAVPASEDGAAKKRVPRRKKHAAVEKKPLDEPAAHEVAEGDEGGERPSVEAEPPAPLPAKRRRKAKRVTASDTSARSGEEALLSVLDTPAEGAC
jgi:hypothetical protein